MMVRFIDLGQTFQTLSVAPGECRDDICHNKHHKLCLCKKKLVLVTFWGLTHKITFFYDIYVYFKTILTPRVNCSNRNIRGSNVSNC